MAVIATRQQFIDYCKRRLGHPVIEINVDDDQVDDRVDEALEFWQDYHFDGTEKLYLKHKMTQADMDRQYILIPDKIVGVTAVLPFDDSASSVNMFDLRYQLRLHDLYDFTSVSYVSYEITMQHLRTLNLLFSGTPQFRFQRHRNRLMLDINWAQDVHVGSYVILECYGKINGDLVTMPGTVSIAAGNTYLIGAAGATFDANFIQDDEIIVKTAGGDVSVTCAGILSNNAMRTFTVWTTTETGLTAYQVGNADVWGDRVLKDLGTAFIKRQWGTNLKKFSGIQMPGGITLNGQQIFDEAEAEIARLKAEFLTWNTLQSDFLMG
jgi:hypothetical protein